MLTFKLLSYTLVIIFEGKDGCKSVEIWRCQDLWISTWPLWKRYTDQYKENRYAYIITSHEAIPLSGRSCFIRKNTITMSSDNTMIYGNSFIMGQATVLYRASGIKKNMQLGCAVLCIFVENNKQNHVHISLCVLFVSDTTANAKHKFTFFMYFFRGILFARGWRWYENNCTFT